jgi:hypothetical protein
MGVTTSPMQTCPEACPYRGRGCYSNYGPLLIWWRAMSEASGDTGAEYAAMLDRVAAMVPPGAMWRHNQAGDLIGDGRRLDAMAAGALVHVNRDRKGFTYTHYPVIQQNMIDAVVSDEDVAFNRKVVEQMNAKGFAVNVSCNSSAHADRVADSRIKAPITCTLPEQVKKDKVKFVTSPAGRRILVCPNVSLGKTCAKCKLCAMPKREVIIGFPCHGSGKKRAEEVLAEWATGEYVPVIHAKRKDGYKLRHTPHMGRDKA